MQPTKASVTHGGLFQHGQRIQHFVMEAVGSPQGDGYGLRKGKRLESSWDTSPWRLPSHWTGTRSSCLSHLGAGGGGRILAAPGLPPGLAEGQELQHLRHHSLQGSTERLSGIFLQQNPFPDQSPSGGPMGCLRVGVPSLALSWSTWSLVFSSEPKAMSL